jgi:hypothetical protein
MSGQTDWVQYVLDRPMVNEPGVSYNYNTGGSHLLSAILEVATGNQTEDYAKKFLFDPLNITNYYWKTDPTGLTRGGEGLYLIPRDMAKFGYLILHNGTWDNTQVVSSEWTRKATTKQTSTYTGNYDYGYQWWVRNQFYSLRYFMAHGFLGQRIYIVPEKNLVVIFTCDEPIFDIQTVLVENYIIPATNFSTVSSTSSSFSYFPFILGIAVISLFNKKKRLN